MEDFGLDEPRTLIVTVSGDKQYTLTQEQYEQSGMIRAMLECDPRTQETSLPSISPAIMDIIYAWMSRDTDEPLKIPRPVPSTDFSKCVSAWYANFADRSLEVLYEVIIASNYLEITDLMDLFCAKLASMIKDKTPHQIIKTFNLENTRTPEEIDAEWKGPRWPE
jgi:S-phase kinase-associated protein 1